jgi:hypothetical protein
VLLVLVGAARARHTASWLVIRGRKGTPPAYPARPHNGQARITIRAADGSRKDIYLGAFGSPESRKEYQRILTGLEAAGGRLQVGEDRKLLPDLTVAELLERFWKHAEQYYRLLDGSPSRERHSAGYPGCERPR